MNSHSRDLNELMIFTAHSSLIRLPSISFCLLPVSLHLLPVSCPSHASFIPSPVLLMRVSCTFCLLPFSSQSHSISSSSHASLTLSPGPSNASITLSPALQIPRIPSPTSLTPSPPLLMPVSLRLPSFSCQPHSVSCPSHVSLMYYCRVPRVSLETVRRWRREGQEIECDWHERERMAGMRRARDQVRLTRIRY